jgi:hypothetical protein
MASIHGFQQASPKDWISQKILDPPMSKPNTPEKVLLTLGAEIESVSKSIDYSRSI